MRRGLANPLGAAVGVTLMVAGAVAFHLFGRVSRLECDRSACALTLSRGLAPATVHRFPLSALDVSVRSVPRDRVGKPEDALFLHFEHAAISIADGHNDAMIQQGT